MWNKEIIYTKTTYMSQERFKFGRGVQDDMLSP